MIEAANSIFNKIKVLLALILGTEVSSVASSAIDPLIPVTFLTSAAAETRTLGNAPEGTVKRIIAKATLTGTVTVTPSALALVGAVHTTIAFDAVGDSWTGIFHAGEWHAIGQVGVTYA